MRAGFQSEPLTITSEGTYDVRSYASVVVEIEGDDPTPPTPSASIETISFSDYQLAVKNGTLVTDGTKTYLVEL